MKGIRHGKVPKKLFRAVVAAGSGKAVRTSPSRLPFFPAAHASQLTGCDSLPLLRHEKRSAVRSFGAEGIRHGKVPKKLFRAVVAAGSGEAVRTSPSRLPFFPAALTSQLTGCDSLPLLRHEKRRTMCVFFRGGEGGIRTLEPFYRLHDFQSCALDQARRLLRIFSWAVQTAPVPLKFKNFTLSTPDTSTHRLRKPLRLPAFIQALRLRLRKGFFQPAELLYHTLLPLSTFFWRLL